jgi:DNA invertase Pin-like site-specific DNA recombinase
VPPVRAGLYGRISLARFGETIKVDEQLALCEKLAAERGWTVAERYGDPNQSAWRRDRIRPGWDRMLADVQAGRINAIIVYHGDRLVRQPWDLEMLLRLADEKGVRLASPTGERNLDSPDDRFILRIEAAQACRESDNTSRRLRWHYDKAATRGVVRLGGRGGRAYGFEPDGLTVRSADARWIREVATRIISGEPIGAIARDISDRGARTTTGRRWQHGSLNKLMRRARLAGLVAHNGEIVGVAAWPAILERERWETVCAVLDRKAAVFDYATNARRHLLTGIAHCGTCDEPLVVRYNKGSVRAYGCINRECPRKLHRVMAYLDEYVIAYVLAFLARTDVAGELAPHDETDWPARLAQLQATRQRRIDEFAGDDDADADIIRATVRRIDAEIADVRARIAEAAAPHVLDGAWGIDRAGWDALPLERRRMLVGAIARVTIYPSRRGPGFDPSSVRIERAAQRG